ncbi:hypothetical protein IAD21_03690 [Abditibacteriota bacterium]|nr:hypothetical protein IAD21_03690 [Abditibacteriota bacterium]
MKRVLLTLLTIGTFATFAQAQTPPATNAATEPGKLETPLANNASPLEAGEIALEGEVRAINGVTGEVTIMATAFATPTGRKTFPTAKAKTLVTTGATKFVDRRVGTLYALSDLSIGLQLRAVGRDGGTGKPMNARLLEWQSLEPQLPPDPDTPIALAGLLPPPQDSKGVKVRVIDSGFQPENRIFNWSKEGRPVFFVTYRVFPPRNAKIERPVYEWGNLKELRGPNGAIIRSSGAGSNVTVGEGRTLSFPRVNPKWKSVTAIWETTSPDARPDSSGRFQGQFQLAGTLPTPAKPKSEPQTRLETPHGTVYVLQSIECDWEKKTSTYILSVEKPDDVPDVSVDTHIDSISDDKNRNLKSGHTYQRGTDKQITLAVPVVPEAGAKEAHLSLSVTERSDSWKQKEAYSNLEIELPVASLLKANPPVAPAEVAAPTEGEQGALPAWNAENETFSARIEEVQRADSLLGTVWVAPKIKTDDGAVRTLVETVAMPVALRARTADGHDHPVILFGTEADDTFFHSDGGVPTSGEIAMRFNSDTGQSFGDETAFSLDVRSFKRLQSDVDLKALAISPDTQRALDEPMGDGGLMLQKIAWLGTEATDKMVLRTGGQLQFKGKTGLILVFSHTPIAPDSQIKLDSVTMRDDTGKMQTTGWTMWKGDALSGEANNALTLILPAPTDGTKTVDIHLHATETGPDEATSTLEFPGVKWQKYKG